jgi:hypothetical protein
VRCAHCAVGLEPSWAANPALLLRLKVGRPLLSSATLALVRVRDLTEGLVPWPSPGAPALRPPNWLWPLQALAVSVLQGYDRAGQTGYRLGQAVVCPRNPTVAGRVLCHGARQCGRKTPGQHSRTLRIRLPSSARTRWRRAEVAVDRLPLSTNGTWYIVTHCYSEIALCLPARTAGRCCRTARSRGWRVPAQHRSSTAPHSRSEIG